MKHLGTSILAVVSISALLVLTQRQAHANRDDGPDDLERHRIEIGLRIAPVALDFDRDDRDDRQLVGLGSYLVNAIGGCNDCHTNPSYAVGGNPYLGQPKQINAAHYLGGGQLFGPFVSRDITPENGRPAGRSFGEFKTIMRTGIDYKQAHPQISPLLQVMPWPTYQSMTDHEILAIYEYLKAIPPATPEP